MQIAIYGAGRYGQYIYDEIANCDYTKMSVLFWIDNFVKGEICGLPIYTEADFINEHKYQNVDAVVVAINNTKRTMVAEEAAASLLLHGYEHVYIALPEGFRFNIPVLNENGYFSSYIKFYKEIKPTAGMILSLVTNQCNLNCKRCFHLSNIAKEKNFLELDIFENYLQQLKKKFRNILQFQLLGGEPLLVPQLEKYIILARKYFPGTELEIVTNGLLITKMSSDLIHAIVKYNVVIYISQYIPTRRLLDQIIDFLEEKQINYTFLPFRTKFRKWMTLKEQSGNKAFEKWKVNDCRCHVVGDGRIYQCPCIPRLYAEQDYFGIHIGEEELQASSIDLMDDNVDGWDIMKYFSHSTSICRFCSPEAVWVEWETGKPCKEDWIVD